MFSEVKDDSVLLAILIISAQLKNSQEGKTDWPWLDELLTRLLELVMYVGGQGCSWIDSPVRITLMGVE